jgi:uncharacterized protein (TIGR02722 family)
MISKKSLTILGMAAATACTPEFQGEYSDPKMVEVISDKWNETDARTTGEVLIHGMLSKPWLGEYTGSHKGTRPVVIVAEVENRTDEHIDTKALTEAVQDELLNSGKVRFVDGENRDKVLKEIQYQSESGMVSKNSAKGPGKQTGADFMLTGAISSNVQTQKGLKTITYQVVLHLTNLETGEKEWSQKHDIKKRVKRSGSAW